MEVTKFQKLFTKFLHQDFCNTIFAGAKLSILHGHSNNYRPCWDAVWEHFYEVFLRVPQSKATSLAVFAWLSHLNEKQKDRWSEAVNNIDLRTPVGWHGT